MTAWIDEEIIIEDDTDLLDWMVKDSINTHNLIMDYIALSNRVSDIIIKEFEELDKIK